jgi:hypothetical protein
MRKFLLNLFGFSVLFLSLVAGLLYAPPTPRAQTSLLMAAKQKRQLLLSTPSPRIIFVGGSNLSFGLDCGMIKDSLHLNPVNMAVHASIGLIFMMDDVSEFIRPGDLVVLSPEYAHFAGQFAFGGEELLRTVFDAKCVSPLSLRVRQYIRILPYLPKYLKAKLQTSEYNQTQSYHLPWYQRSSFNEFGDVNVHWGQNNMAVEPYGPVNGKVEQVVIDAIQVFNRDVEQKGGKLLITYPCIQERTFVNMQSFIHQVQVNLESTGSSLLGTPERYMMHDSLLFNTPYHLNREGARFRTQLLLEDLSTYLHQSEGGGD